MKRYLLPLLMLGLSCKSRTVPTTSVAGTLPPTPAQDAGDSDSKVALTIHVDRVSVGGSRSFLWARTGVEPAGAPLMMVLHGDGGDAASMRQYVGAELERLSLGKAHIAYVEGLDRTWETNTANSPNDGPYIDAVRASFTGDAAPRAVYLFGYSRGGFMANKLACERSQWVTAIASNAGGAPYATALKDAEGVQRCPGQAPVASIVLHGVDDREVPFADAPWTAGYWAYINGCDHEAMTTTAESVCRAYINCPAATPSWFCAVPGVGHAVWKDAPRVAWTFFESLPSK